MVEPTPHTRPRTRSRQAARQRRRKCRFTRVSSYSPAAITTTLRHGPVRPVDRVRHDAPRAPNGQVGPYRTASAARPLPVRPRCLATCRCRAPGSIIAAILSPTSAKQPESPVRVATPFHSVPSARRCCPACRLADRPPSRNDLRRARRSWTVLDHGLSPPTRSSPAGRGNPSVRQSFPSQSRASAPVTARHLQRPERSRYLNTRRRSPGSAAPGPASVSSARCLAIAWRVLAAAPCPWAVAGPLQASADMMARRVGTRPARAEDLLAARLDSGCGIEVPTSSPISWPTPCVGVVADRLASSVPARNRNRPGQPRAARQPAPA